MTRAAKRGYRCAASRGRSIARVGRADVGHNDCRTGTNGRNGHERVALREHSAQRAWMCLLELARDVSLASIGVRQWSLTPLLPGCLEPFERECRRATRNDSRALAGIRVQTVTGRTGAHPRERERVGLLDSLSASISSATRRSPSIPCIPCIPRPKELGPERRAASCKSLHEATARSVTLRKASSMVEASMRYR